MKSLPLYFTFIGSPCACFCLMLIQYISWLLVCVCAYICILTLYYRQKNLIHHSTFGCLGYPDYIGRHCLRVSAIIYFYWHPCHACFANVNSCKKNWIFYLCIRYKQIFQQDLLLKQYQIYVVCSSHVNLCLSCWGCESVQKLNAFQRNYNFTHAFTKAHTRRWTNTTFTISFQKCKWPLLFHISFSQRFHLCHYFLVKFW